MTLFLSCVEIKLKQAQSFPKFLVQCVTEHLTTNLCGVKCNFVLGIMVSVLTTKSVTALPLDGQFILSSTI